jgi:rhodanese-related sulfurtransferase
MGKKADKVALLVLKKEKNKKGSLDMHHSEGFLNRVNEAKKNIQEISIESLEELKSRGESLKLVDVREDLEWQKGHLPEAIHLGKGIIERDIEQRVEDKKVKIVLYCGGGFRSALAAESLQCMNYKNVFSLIGGFKAWKSRGNLIIEG